MNKIKIKVIVKFVFFWFVPRSIWISKFLFANKTKTRENVKIIKRIVIVKFVNYLNYLGYLSLNLIFFAVAICILITLLSFFSQFDDNYQVKIYPLLIVIIWILWIQWFFNSNYFYSVEPMNDENETCFRVFELETR